MSLSLTRRIARTALLVAAGAAPVVGAAGTASAADLPVNTHVAGLTLPDTAAAHGTLGTAAHRAVRTADRVGGNTVHQVPGGRVVGPAAGSAVHAVGSDATGTAVGTASGAVQGVPAAELPTGLPAA